MPDRDADHARDREIRRGCTASEALTSGSVDQDSGAMAKTDVQHDVIVIGAGIAGLVASNRAAQLGKRGIVLEKSKEERYLCNSRSTYGTFHINYTDVAADEDVLFSKIEACSDGLARKDLARAIAKDGRRV